jgi:hypothetical protein
MWLLRCGGVVLPLQSSSRNSLEFRGCERLCRCASMALQLYLEWPSQDTRDDGGGVFEMKCCGEFQAVLDNLAAENALDCALAAAHLFTACSDASLLTKQHRLAVLCAATLREARDGCTGSDALAAAAVTAAVKHLHMVHASADAAGATSGAATGVITSMVSLAVRSRMFCQSWPQVLLLLLLGEQLFQQLIVSLLAYIPLIARNLILQEHISLTYTPLTPCISHALGAIVAPQEYALYSNSVLWTATRHASDDAPNMYVSNTSFKCKYANMYISYWAWKEMAE